ncbi:MAG: HTH domain-containing protein, partial [Gammaproteobacteria bacterium]
MDKSYDLLAALADGRAHSGASLAARLHVSRAAVWNRVKRLQALGVDNYAVRGKGYQLARGFEFLNEHAIRHALAPDVAAEIGSITVSQVTDSTNQRLLELVPTAGVHGHAWLAEYQTAGRGRRGDRWLAPPGSAVCLSLGWRFESPPKDLSALSLV